MTDYNRYYYSLSMQYQKLVIVNLLKMTEVYRYIKRTIIVKRSCIKHERKLIRYKKL